MVADGPSLQFKSSTTDGPFLDEEDIQKAALDLYEYAR